MSELVSVEKKNGVAHIIFNSPPANAMSVALMRQLGETVEKIATDPSSRAVVIRSAVNKMFMAGADLKYFKELKEESLNQYVNTIQDTLNRIEMLSKPTIAVLSGHTLGGGCELALCCDFRYMSETKARIGLPEVTLGLLPGGGGTQRLARLIGRNHATELLLRGNTLKGAEALRIGLVDRIFPLEELLAESIKLAEELSKGATLAIGEIKECLRIPSQAELSEGLSRERAGITYLFLHTDDAEEGIAAFNEKRPPKYKGK